MLDAFGNKRPVVLAASTHAGEDALIATAVREAAPAALAVIVPRHAERRAEVKLALEGAGFSVVMRSQFQEPSAEQESGHVFVIDSTGELRDWTAHADVVVIGKSFLASGGQNPAEAILAGKPVVFGPHMENFEPLASRLSAARGAIRAEDAAALPQAIAAALEPSSAAAMTRRATQLLACHDGATRRMIDLLCARR
jgi:3-deoxy-D-manno-octulosonic-acid transferase